ncbi:MAG: hypothetical protein ACOCY5_04325 [Desulfohalobiaceae bacterium]
MNPYSPARGISCWILHPGMLFDSPWKWWSDLGKRPFAHEGLDLCRFATTCGQTCTVSPETVFPALYSGTVALIIQDFLAQSIFIRHGAWRSSTACLYSIYAHACPLPGILQDKAVSQAEPLCAVPSPSKCPSGMQAHLHISMAWIQARIPESELGWSLLNSRQGLELEDPLRWMHCQYQIDHNPFPLHTG